ATSVPINVVAVSPEIVGGLFLMNTEAPGFGVPLALIITEAVTNAVKYAFPEGRSGTVAVGVCHDGETLTLTIRDDGIGIAAAEASDAAAPRGGLGAMLIAGFARPLGATLTTETDGSGTVLTLAMPIRRRRQAKADQAEAAIA
ncbi:MAG TPA: sensor histidine kinase, partial [Candidatus Saccharibacteria bacterium]|nr:sensor histidine kinase [Candidatus Saccharibacteria bacterium]